MSSKTQTTATTEEATPALVPKLRFPEFQGTEAWHVTTLDSVCEVLNNRRKPITGNDRTPGPYPYYGASGIVDYVGDFIFDERLLLVGEDGAKWGAFEKTAFIAEGKYWVNNHAHVLKPFAASDTLLENYLTMQDLSPFVTGAAPPKLTLGKLKGIPVPLTPKPAEQQKIAECLSSLDELIAALARKVDALKTHKKGLMQQLFPREGETQPRLRFPEFQNAGEWDTDGLGVVADFVNEKIPLERVALENYVSTENILADFGGVHSASKLPTTSSVTRFQLNDTLVSNIRPYLKKVWVADKEGGASNDVIVIRAKHKLLPKYLAALLKNDAFIDYVMTGAKGVKMPRGDIGSMKAYPALYPSKPEQQRIANCLSSLDALISAETQKLEALKTHKKALMQQLFPVMDARSEVEA
jgi:type I restriction enzyme S subunit